MRRVKEEAEERLRKVFARRLAERGEGVVFEAEEGTYGCWKSPSVKLKKGYIPRKGDSLDFVLLQAAWNKDCAKESFESRTPSHSSALTSTLPNLPTHINSFNYCSC